MSRASLAHPTLNAKRPLSAMVLRKTEMAVDGILPAWGNTTSGHTFAVTEPRSADINDPAETRRLSL